MKLIKTILAGAVLTIALSAFADAPTSEVNPRNAILTAGSTNGVGYIVEVLTNGTTYIGVTNGVTYGGYTNIILTMAYQHEMSVTTIITPTNAVPNGTNTVGSTANWTNYFDLGKVVSSNGVLTTNWTTTPPIQITGAFNNLVPTVYSFVLNHTNFDGYELIRDTKIGSGAANNYGFEVILGQTP